jgi:hypothetical protein
LWRLIGRTSGPIDPSDPNLLHSIKPTFPSWISFIQVVLANEEVHWTRHKPRGRAGRNSQGRPCLVVRPCLARVACCFQFLPKCVPAYEIHNITRGTLLVMKMCMKLVVYSSRTQGFDGQILVVRTVNTAAHVSSMLRPLTPLPNRSPRRAPLQTTGYLATCRACHRLLVRHRCPTSHLH